MTAVSEQPTVRPDRRRRPWIGLVLVTLLGAVLSWMQLDWFILPSADSTTYAILAEALATGQGYRLISEPLATPMNFYPPGLPLLLAGIVRGAMGLGWVPADGLLALVLPLKAVSWLSFVASIPLLALVAQRRAAPGVALAAALVWAVNPIAGSFANAIMAEMPLITLSLLAVVLLEHSTASPRRLLWTLGGGLTLAAAFFMRTSAIFLVAAVLGWLLLRRQVRSAVVVGCVVAVCVLPWLIRSAANPTSGSPVVGSYIDQLLASETYATQRIDAAGLLARGLSNAGEYVQLHGPAMIWPHSERLPVVLRTLLGAVFTLVAAWGLVVGWRRAPGLAELYTVIFVASTLVWPWRAPRFLLPALPFLLMALVVGGEHLVRQLAQRLGLAGGGRWLALAGLVVLVLSPLWVSAAASGVNVRRDRQVPMAEALAKQPGWTGYLDALTRLQVTTGDDSVIMARNARMAYLLIQRRGVDYPYTTDPAALARAIDGSGVDYIIEDQFTWTATTGQFLVPTMQALRDRFVLEFETGTPPTRVWRVLPGK